MPWGIVIPADEAAPLEFRLFGQLIDYQEAVNGLIESIDLPSVGASFFVNEEGKLHSDPLNRRASLLWWSVAPPMRRVDAILGNVILIGPPDEDGETQDVPGELVTLLMKTELYKYEVKTAEREDKWYGNNTRFDNYFSACNDALALLDRWLVAVDVRVVAA